jgi:Domain of unknown function (DUF4281)
MEGAMSAAQVFEIASFAAMAGWLVLIAGIVLQRPALRDGLAGRWWPIGLSALYGMLVLFFFGASEGGFDSLANVKLLFQSDWALLAGWVHYLAFDLFMGAWIARQFADAGLPRWPLVVILPLTFLFGPAGFLAFEASRLLLSPSTRTGMKVS